MSEAAKRFSVVPSEVPDPPYDHHTMSNGFGFDLDVIRMQNSDSWVICPVEVRPWMMMSWVISWAQHPCGSLPSDEEMIAARIGCSIDFLQVHRRYILRGWIRHSDGRLYHPIVTEKVLKMVENREKWRAKKKGQRASNQQVSENVSGDTRGTLGGVPGVSPPSSSSSSSTSFSDEGTNVPLSIDSADAPIDRAVMCPHLDIIDIYHETLPELRRIVKSRWSGSNDAEALRTRWRESHIHQSLDFWRRFFAEVRQNMHWMGHNDRGWKADLRWLVKRANFDKVIDCMATRRRQGMANG